ncbi:MAG: hypothetical protein AB1489_17530 [Acidobacteriota bacterium]
MSVAIKKLQITASMSTASTMVAIPATSITYVTPTTTPIYNDRGCRVLWATLLADAINEYLAGDKSAERFIFPAIARLDSFSWICEALGCSTERIRERVREMKKKGREKEEGEDDREGRNKQGGQTGRGGSSRPRVQVRAKATYKPRKKKAAKSIIPLDDHSLR